MVSTVSCSGKRGLAAHGKNLWTSMLVSNSRSGPGYRPSAFTWVVAELATLRAANPVHWRLRAQRPFQAQSNCMRRTNGRTPPRHQINEVSKDVPT
jgi:hypothetical protein